MFLSSDNKWSLEMWLRGSHPHLVVQIAAQQLIVSRKAASQPPSLPVSYSSRSAGLHLPHFSSSNSSVGQVRLSTWQKPRNLSAGLLGYLSVSSASWISSWRVQDVPLKLHGWAQLEETTLTRTISLRGFWPNSLAGGGPELAPILSLLSLLHIPPSPHSVPSCPTQHHRNTTQSL